MEMLEEGFSGPVSTCSPPFSGKSAVSWGCQGGQVATAVTMVGGVLLAVLRELELMGKALEDASGGLVGNKQCPICS